MIILHLHLRLNTKQFMEKHVLQTRVAKVSNRKIFDRMRLRILTPKQMLQVLLIVLAQVKAGNTSENLLNEIKQIINSLY